jgi:hypothetical protein
MLQLSFFREFLAREYPRPIMTDQELLLFKGDEAYTPLINAALDTDGDPSP